MQQHERARRDQAEYRIKINRSAEAILKLTKSEEWKWVDNYFTERQLALVNSLTTPAAGGDGMSIAMRAENDKGALQEIRRFIGVMGNILEEYHKLKRLSDVVDGDEVPQTAKPPENEAEAVNPEVAARQMNGANDAA